MNQRLLYAIFFLALLGCQTRIPEDSEWTGSVTLADERKLPLRLHLNLNSDAASGTFIVSNEYTEIPEISVSGDSINIVISEYQAAMKGKWDGTQWSGHFIRYRQDTVRLPFSVVPGPQAPDRGSSPQPSSAIRLTGTFQVHYHDPDGIDSSSMAKFWTRGDSVFGTFIDPSGDHGLMAGIQKGDSAWLGRFIGWQANLIELKIEEGTWKGRYYARQLPPDIFTLVPRPGLPGKISDGRRTRMKEPGLPFRFEGLSIDGDTVKYTDPQFKGKAVIVDIMGTWCHNCLDEAPVLQQLYEEFHEQGLEIVGLSFEVTDDPQTGRNNLSIYQKRHGLTFPLLYSGSLDPENVESRIRSQLEDFFAYPTTLFIDRTGRVREIHWGFKGPGTGEEYQREIELFYRMAKELVH